MYAVQAGSLKRIENIFYKSQKGTSHIWKAYEPRLALFFCYEKLKKLFFLLKSDKIKDKL